MSNKSKCNVVVYATECSDETDLHSLFKSVVSGIGKNNRSCTSGMKSESKSDINSVLNGGKPLCDHSGRGVDLARSKCISCVIGAYKLSGKTFFFKESVVLSNRYRSLAKSARVTDMYRTSGCGFSSVKCLKLLIGKLCIVYIGGSGMLCESSIAVSVITAVIAEVHIAAILRLLFAAVIIRTGSAYCGSAGCQGPHKVCGQYKH